MFMGPYSCGDRAGLRNRDVFNAVLGGVPIWDRRLFIVLLLPLEHLQKLFHLFFAGTASKVCCQVLGEADECRLIFFGHVMEQI